VFKKIDYLEKNLCYHEYGAGHPVVLIHGFAEDSGIWKDQVAFLQHKFRVLVPDMPGSGESTYNDRLVTIEDFAEAIKNMLDKEKIGETVLIGHSMGGYIALAFAEKYSQRLTGLGLFHSTAYADSEEKKAARRKSIGFIREYGVPEFVKSTMPNLFSGEFNANQPETISKLVNKYSYFSPEALITYYEAMIMRPDRRKVLKELNKPILFICGEEDKAVPFRDALEQAHIPDLSFIHILKNTAHMGLVENPDLTNHWLAGFIEASCNPTW